MSGVVTIYLRCVVIPIKVLYGYGSHLSPIEQITMRMIATCGSEFGKIGADELIDLLGLGRSIANDVISGLWHRGHLALDFRTGEICLSARAMQFAMEGRLDELEAGELKEADAEVMYEQLTGIVLPVSGGRRPAEERLAVPASWGDTDLVDSVPHADVLNALRFGFAQKNGSGRKRKVVSARIAPAELRRTKGIRFLPVDVRVGLDGDTDRLRFSVLSRTLPERQRRLIADRLAEMAEADPKSPFVEAVHAKADHVYAEPAPLEERLEQIERTAAGAADAPPGTRGQRHRELREAAERLVDEIKFRVSYEVRPELLRDDGNLEAIEQLIWRAERQLVLVCPSPRWSGIRRFTSALEEALTRGVQIVLIWGRSSDDEFDHGVARVLTDLAQRVGGNHARLLRSGRSSKIHVNLAVADDREAVLTGLNFMVAGGRDQEDARGPVGRERGIRLTAPRADAPCRVIEDLLAWCARVVPEYTLARSIYVRHEDFHTRHEDAAGPGPAGEAPGREPDRRAHRADEPGPDAVIEALDHELGTLPSPPADSEGAASGGDASVWSQAWVEKFRKLRDILAKRPLPAARLVQNGEHRDVLWKAIREARQRLVIANPDLRSALVPHTMIRALDRRMDEGLRVTVALGPNCTDAAADLERLRKKKPRLTLVIKPGNARCLVADDEVVIGSFAYLCDPPGMPYGELSVAIRDAALADQLAGGLGRTSAMAPASSEPIIESSGGYAQSLHTLMREIDDGRPVREAVADSMRETPDPWSYVEYVRTARVSPTVKWAVAARALRLHRDSAGAWVDDQAPAVVEWLVSDLWRDGRFFEAAILRTAVPSEEFRPRARLTRTVLVRNSEAIGDAVADAALDEGGPHPERIALAAVCAAELLVGRGHPEAYEALSLLDDLPDPWRRLTDALTRHQESFARPLPLNLIQADIDRARRRQTEEALWGELEEAYTRAEQVKVRFDQITRAHAHLFSKDQVFGRLRPLIDARDADGVRRWLEQPELNDLGALLDRVTLQLSPGTAVLEGKRRSGYLRRFQGVLTAATNLGWQSAESGAGDRIPSAVHAIAEELAGLWKSLLSTAGDDPEARLTHAILEDLAVIRRWKS